MAQRDQPAQTIVVTGATSGIGRAVAEGLALRGFDVIGVGRDQARAAAAEAELAEQYPATKVAYLIADLSLQQNIRSLARDIEAQLSDWGRLGLDGLINNAGTFTFWQELTAEGFETQWAVNHLAPFLLSHELLPSLVKAPGARIITVSSGSHNGTQLNWEDPQLLRRYNPLQAYKQTKLANVLFTVEFNRRFTPTHGVQALAADPGLVDTDIGHKSNSWLSRFIWSLRRRSGISAERSAAGIIELLLNPDLEVADQRIYWKHGKYKEPDPVAFDPAAAWRLWEISARMCGVAQQEVQA